MCLKAENVNDLDYVAIYRHKGKATMPLKGHYLPSYYKGREKLKASRFMKELHSLFDTS